MADSDITVEILKDIRNEIRGLRADTNQRFDAVNERLDATNKRLDVGNERLDITIQRLDVTNERLDVISRRFDGTNERLDITIQRLDVSIQRLDTVESTLLDLAQQQRFIVRYTKAISERDADLPPRVSALESRVDKLESK